MKTITRIYEVFSIIQKRDGSYLHHPIVTFCHSDKDKRDYITRAFSFEQTRIAMNICDSIQVKEIEVIEEDE